MIILGSFMSGLFRSVFPIIKKGSIALGQELVKSGVGLAKDIWRTGDIESARKKRGKEFINNISSRASDHMFGSGYTSQHIMNNPQYKRIRRTRKVVKARKPNTKKKIEKN